MLIRMCRAVFAAAVFLAALFASAASYYWLGWPDFVRNGLAILVVPTVAILWFLPGEGRRIRRGIVCGGLCVFFVAYANKSLYPQSFVPLHARMANATFNGDLVTVDNFRDAIHPVGAPAQPRWTTRSFDLGEVSGAQLILQPFGPSLATVHVMTSFEFSNGDRLAFSFEARRTSWDKFDALAGFFKHDQLYPVLGTERDLLWKRLAHIPPNELYVFDLQGTPSQIEAYLRRLLEFVAEVHDTPQFYSTISESCFTTLIKLSPEIEKTVPWFDYRRWVPGASVGLFQGLGLIDSSVSEADLVRRRKLGSGVRPPWEFSGARSWSEHLRSRIGQH
jgi:hypothetical protein